MTVGEYLMKKTAKLTCITALIAGAIAIGLDVWLDARPDSFTWSQYLLKSATEAPLVPAIVGIVFGILLGHFFWPQKK